MTTPNDTTRTTDTTNRTTTDRTTTDPTDPIADTSPRTIPGRTPITEEAGAPLVPTTSTTDRTTADPTATTSPGTRFKTPRRPSPPPADGERDAPLVPDLRPTRRPRTDGGSR